MGYRLDSVVPQSKANTTYIFIGKNL